jgi:DNA-binding MarR family transcriptional regulator
MIDSKMTRKTIEEQANDFIESLGVLIRRARAASASHGLSFAESAVLGRLSRGGPATSAELARAASMRPQSMGATVAALEQAGLVARTPDPADGRRMLVALTRKGAAVRKSTRDAKRTWLVEGISQLDKQDQQTLFAAGEILARLVGTESQ